MTRQSPPELFAQRPVRSDFARRRSAPAPFTPRRLAFLAGALLLALAFGALWSFGSESEDTAPQGEVPVIQADSTIKKRPDDPGGLEIPHQDVEVFQQLNQKTETPAPASTDVERLLPPPEEPLEPLPTTEPAPQPLATEEPASLPPPVTQAEPLAPETPPDMAQKTPEAQGLSQESPPAPVLSSSDTGNVAIKKNKKTEKQPTPAPATKKEMEAATTAAPKARLPEEFFITGEIPPTPTPSVTPEKVSDSAPAQTSDTNGKTVAIQLASFPDQTQAKKEAAVYQARYANLLGGATLNVVRADLGPKGVYYRLISDKMPETKAKAICATLAKKKEGCLLVK